MTTPTPESVKALADLADRVEAAQGPDWRLDDEITAYVLSIGLPPCGRCTASLDAAMQLTDGYFKLQPDSLKGWSALGITGPWSHAVTPALALTAAALRARAAHLGASHA